MGHRQHRASGGDSLEHRPTQSAAPLAREGAREKGGPRVAVAIVNWNSRELLRRCLECFRHQNNDLDVRVVVVDNGSSDGSAAMVARGFPWVRLLAQDVNEGFAARVNRAIRVEPADYVLLLNPDVEVLPGSIRSLVEFLERTPTAAAVSPMLIGPDGAPQTYPYRRFPSVAQPLLFWTILEPLARRVPFLRRRYFEYDRRGAAPVLADQLPGASMLIRGSALREIGPLDPDYFLWCEDLDWCYRARQAGALL